MAILPVRGLGDVGIITDINPYDLPPNALSQGNNIRCSNRRITRSPAFKSIVNTTATVPVFCYTYAIPDGPDKLGIVHNTGTSYFFDGVTQEDVTPAVFTPATSALPFTHCVLANVSYLNRGSDVPQYYLPTSTDYTKLANWPATYTCRVLRAFKSFLIAINVTKAGTAYPSLVKWSDITLTNSIPASWDETDPTLSAGENPIQDLTAPLLDGLSLRGSFILYTKNQVVLMEYTADNEIFRFRNLFNNIGIINTNCVVEAEGKHFVFGKDDIYVHDGVSHQSIITGKNQKYVFENIINSESDKFFVAHNIKLTEVMFCYVSSDGHAGFAGTTYCNRAAVFNYTNGTWTFRDLPNTPAATNAALSYTTVTYISVAPETYDSLGGSYADLSDTSLKSLYFTSPLDVSGNLTASRLYGYDDIYVGTFSQPITVEATKASWAERIGIDLDETGEQLRTYKVIKTIYPQAKALGGTSNISFSFGATEFDDLTPTFNTPVNFDPMTNHKVDVRIGGRYLAWKANNSSLYSHELSGFDIDIQATGRR